MKILFLFVCFSLCLQILYATEKQDIIADYNCGDVSSKTTIVRDSDSDGDYDQYTMIWCDNSRDTYTIKAIGDISKWPPTGIPTRNMFNANINNKTFVECYFSYSTKIAVTWFVKYADNDTVYFYDNEPEFQFMTDIEDYNSENLSFVLSPNPANDFINFDYAVNSSGWVKITLYNEIGIVVDLIEEKYKAEGKYNLVYYTDKINSGKYFITVRIGEKEIFTRQISIVK